MKRLLVGLVLVASLLGIGAPAGAGSGSTGPYPQQLICVNPAPGISVEALGRAQYTDPTPYGGWNVQSVVGGFVNFSNTCGASFPYGDPQQTSWGTRVIVYRQRPFGGGWTLCGDRSDYTTGQYRTQATATLTAYETGDPVCQATNWPAGWTLVYGNFVAQYNPYGPIWENGTISNVVNWAFVV